jgi:nitrite reductase/ring-hydroxylating ferredoxin subunit
VHEPGWHAAGPLGELPEGTLQERWLGGNLVVLVRRGDQVRAVAGHCPHKFTSLAGGILEGDALTCPLHAACFDLATGVPAPGQEWAGRLPVYPTRVREGIVEVQAPAEQG